MRRTYPTVTEGWVSGFGIRTPCPRDGPYPYETNTQTWNENAIDTVENAGGRLKTRPVIAFILNLYSAKEKKNRYWHTYFVTAKYF